MDKEEISKRKCLELNENENEIQQNVWWAVKAVLRGKFIILIAYIKKEENSQINNLSFLLKKLENQCKIHSK